MPVLEGQRQVAEIQQDFSGGMHTLGNPAANQYEFGLNVSCRNTHLDTRPGIHRTFDFGLTVGFFFDVGQDGVGGGGASDFFFRDPATGVGFEFVRDVFPNIQGIGVFNFPAENREFVIFVSDGAVFRNRKGFVQSIATSEPIATTEVITFVQANDRLVMFRGTAGNPLQWDGGAAGFQDVAAPLPGFDAIPQSAGAIYQAGRLWAIVGRDTIAVSDLLSISNWDGINNEFAIQPGDGDELVNLHPYHEDNIIAFKRKSVHVLTGIVSVNLPITLQRHVVNKRNGLFGKNAVITVGEQVWFMSRNGISSIQRNEQNRLQGIELPISAEIEGLFSHVNFLQADEAQAATHENFIMFAVPMETAERNNAILAYDLLANGRRGAWCGLWKSGMTRIQNFFLFERELFFIDFEGFFHKMLTDDPVDSDDPAKDVEEFSATRLYQKDDLVKVDISGVFRVFKSKQVSKGITPPDTIYWEEISDVKHALDIQSEALTRPYDFREPASSKGMGKAEILFRHSDPKIDVSVLSPDDPFTEEVIFEDVEYDRRKYDVADTPDWVDTNVNTDFQTPHRRDYTLMVTDGGLLCDERGLTVNRLESHNLRFIKPIIDNHRYSIRIKNKRGRFELHQVTVSADIEPFASRDR